MYVHIHSAWTAEAANHATNYAPDITTILLMCIHCTSCTCTQSCTHIIIYACTIMYTQYLCIYMPYVAVWWQCHRQGLPHTPEPPPPPPPLHCPRNLYTHRVEHTHNHGSPQEKLLLYMYIHDATEPQSFNKANNESGSVVCEQAH